MILLLVWCLLLRCVASCFIRKNAEWVIWEDASSKVVVSCGEHRACNNCRGYRFLVFLLLFLSCLLAVEEGLQIVFVQFVGGIDYFLLWLFNLWSSLRSNFSTLLRMIFSIRGSLFWKNLLRGMLVLFKSLWLHGTFVCGVFIVVISFLLIPIVGIVRFIFIFFMTIVVVIVLMIRISSSAVIFLPLNNSFTLWGTSNIVFIILHCSPCGICLDQLWWR